jgi:hypothetical protein
MNRLLRSILFDIVGFVFFMIIVLIGLALSPPQTIFYTIFSFLYQHIPLLLMVTILFILADVFLALPFPASVISPFFSAFGAVGITVFAISAIITLDNYLNLGIGNIIASYTNILLLLVFIITFIIGLINATSIRTRRPLRRRRVRRDVPDEYDLI